MKSGYARQQAIAEKVLISTFRDFCRGQKRHTPEATANYLLSAFKGTELRWSAMSKACSEERKKNAE